MYWLSEHTAKENLLAIHFDMFGMVYSLITLLFMFDKVFTCHSFAEVLFG